MSAWQFKDLLIILKKNISRKYILDWGFKRKKGDEEEVACLSSLEINKFMEARSLFFSTYLL